VVLTPVGSAGALAAPAPEGLEFLGILTCFRGCPSSYGISP
jgi:hypothetical protein